jgi:hypothetical protein
VLRLSASYNSKFRMLLRTRAFKCLMGEIRASFFSECALTLVNLVTSVRDAPNQRCVSYVSVLTTLLKIVLNGNQRTNLLSI